MIHRIAVTAVVFCAVSATAFAQNYSLRQCIEYTAGNNPSIRIAGLESGISRKKVSEQVGTGLPQINASGDVKNNTDIATSMLPGELMQKPGTFIPIKMGTKYNATGAIELTQKLFDASFWIGLKAAKLSESRSELSIRDTEENAYFNVCLAYYGALVIQKQLENMQTVLAASKRTLESAELRLANGMVKRTDVDRIRVSYNVINSHVLQIDMNYRQSLNRLKFQMGMPVENAITLSDSLPDIGNWEMASTVEHSAFPENRVDFLLRKVDLDLYEADRSNNIAAYFPKLSLYANYSYMSYTKSFDGLTKSENWYPFSAIGLQLRIPIFSGFSRLFKVDQSTLAVEKAKENVRLTEQAIKVEVSNCDIQYKTAFDNIVNERDNLLLAERVYKDTQQRYAEGTMSALDLVQSESSLRETQNNYFSRLLDLYTAKLNSEKANGTMLIFINNLK